MNKTKLIFFLITVLIISFLAFFAVFYYYIQSYMKSAKFSQFIEKKISEKFSAKVELSKLEWSGLDIFAKEMLIKIPNKNISIITNNLRSSVNIDGFFNKTIRLDNFSIESLSVFINDKKNLISSPEKNEKTKKSNKSFFLSKYLPNNFVISQIKVGSFNFSHRKENIFIENSKATISLQNNDSLIIDGISGIFRANLIKKLNIHEFRLKISQDNVFLEKFRAEKKSGGVMNAKAEFENKNHTINVGFKDFNINDYIKDTLIGKVSGNVSGDLLIKNGEKRGKIITDGILLKNIPLLEQIAKYTKNQKFNNLILEKARSDYEILSNGKIISFSGIDIENVGLLKINGKINIVGQNLGGSLDLGVSKNLLRWLPGSELSVFNISKSDNYKWTIVNISGTINSPKNDLKSRIKKAVVQMPIHVIKDLGYRVLEDGKKVVFEDGTVLLRKLSNKKDRDDIIKSGIDTGTKGIEKGLNFIKNISPF